MARTKLVGTNFRFGDIQAPAILSIPRSTQLIFALLAAVFLMAATVMIVLKVEIVAQGSAKLAHVGQSRDVQPEFTLPVKRILVANGDLVEAGQPLLELEDADIRTEHTRAETEKTRLDREVRTVDFLLSSTNQLIEHVADIEIQSEVPRLPLPDAGQVNMGTLLSYLDELQAEFTGGFQAVQQNTREIQRIEQRRPIYAALSENRKLVLNAAAELFARENVSRWQLLEAESGYQETRLQMLGAEQDIARARDTIALTKSRLRIDLAKRHSQLAEERRDILRRISELDLELVRLGRQVAAATLVSPTSGTVEYIAIFAPSELARAGQNLMKIVPDGEALILEAEVSNSDVGLLKKGQRVNIDYEAYPASRYGIQTGTVVVISTDARKNDEGNWVFAILVKPDRQDLEFNEKRHQLSSGMTARIEIITGERRLFSYFVAPIVAAFQGSLGES